MADTTIPPEEDARRMAAYRDHGSGRAAARVLGISAEAMQRTLKRVTLRAASGDAPAYDMTRLVPPGFNVRGVSTLYNGKGEVAAQWVKSRADDEAREAAMLVAIDARCDAVRAHPPVELLHRPATDLCNLVTITDAHVGALAWHREGGDDWDLKIAKETLTRCFTGMIRRMPSAGVCIINQLGDFLHTDGLVPKTPAHGHVLDADSRYQKMSEVGCDILEDIIAVALECNERVHVIMAEGNHDESGSGWMRILFKRLFRDNPRVTVDDTPLPYYVFRHGQVMLGFHHGHKLKPDQLPKFFAAQFARMWGATDKRYCHSGHQHHLHEKDDGGMRFLQHPTLAARDAYAARGGWISPREAIGITYNETSEDSRMTVTPSMFAPERLAA
jgi:hypothetical protein